MRILEKESLVELSGSVLFNLSFLGGGGGLVSDIVRGLMPAPPPSTPPRPSLSLTGKSLKVGLTLSGKMKGKSLSASTLHPHGLYSHWNSPGQNPGVDSLHFARGIFPTQVELRSPELQVDSYQLRHKETPIREKD